MNVDFSFKTKQKKPTQVSHEQVGKRMTHLVIVTRFNYEGREEHTEESLGVYKVCPFC